MKDSDFLRADGVPMTKQEVRAVVLDRLELNAAGRFVDVGSGSGSVAVEAALRYPNLNVLAIEQKPSAVALTEENAKRFGCERIHILPQSAPCEFSGRVDAMFIGGSGGQLTELLDWALAHLVENGRLVMTFILQDNLNLALNHLRQCSVASLQCTQLLVSQMTPLGSSYYFKPNNPTFVVACKKVTPRDPQTSAEPISKQGEQSDG
ncbi:cobalt-precorrin 7 C15-methyltransferase [Vibrio xiamenensis]|uniref:Cobalt-precorrin 7 C15-methyltransferase n=1 Tax=Vibrio xiamenensis TaxID=861298 RepID=A0A1G8AHQ1_9VIBR|nr:decarboxylating cobalt-precorrin-6B (C(15))-methyltransferase [Vibrio xiamenensis]SDH20383.1 cobalt-precorrin 7 C15-methyltransferase [Vibrio xiamenensis]